MPNPIFYLIEKQKATFEKRYQLQRKTAATFGKDYFFIEPKVVAGQPSANMPEIMINDVKMQLVDDHISVYQDITPEAGKGETSHHLTLRLQDKEKTLFTAHIHFNVNNKIAFVTLRDAKDNLIALNNIIAISQMAKGIVDPFFNHFWEIYSALSNQYKQQYTLNEEQLTAISKRINPLGPADQQYLVWKEYSAQLDKVIKHFEEWNVIEIQPNQKLLQYFVKLKTHSTVKLSLLKSFVAPSAEKDVQAQSAPVAAVGDGVTEMVPGTQSKADVLKLQLLEIETALKKLNVDKLPEIQVLQPWEKLLTEYELLSKKAQLLQDDDAFLECVLMQRKLEATALSMLIRLMLQSPEYNKIEQADLENLIKMIPKMTEKVLFTAVNNDRPVALQFILQYHPYLNIDAPIVDKSASTLLEKAYVLKFLAVFKVLLEAGAFSDRQDAKGQTLLFRSCLDRREDEMVALLRAGASTFIRGRQSYTAFGALTMIASREPDLNLIRLFLNNCTNIYIDLYQGPTNLGGTPLNFACQQNWCPLIEELLNRGANPLIARESDVNTSISICAAKGHADALRSIFKLSKVVFSSNDLGQAYIHATQKNQSATLTVLQDYAKEKGWTLSQQEETFVLGPGTTTNLLDIMQTRMGSSQLVVPNPLAFLPLPRRSNPPGIESHGQNFTGQAALAALAAQPKILAALKEISQSKTSRKRP